MPYELTKTADRDLKRLYKYGVRQFGRRVADAYYDDLLETFQLIADQPGVGRPVHRGRQKLQVLVHAQHVILYRVRDSGTVVILAIPGQRQDWMRHLR